MIPSIPSSTASSAPETLLVPGGEMLSPVSPCLISTTMDDRVAYELGRGFRPAAYGSFLVGLILFALLILVGRRVRLSLRKGIGLLAGVLVLTGLAMAWMIHGVPVFVPGTAHVHADIALDVDGRPYPLGLPQFQSDEGHVLSGVAHLHMHDGLGSVIHIHAEDVTYGYFLWTLGFDIRRGCMSFPSTPTDPTPRERCDGQEGHWTVLVNGVPEPNIRDRIVQDLDRVLMSYGQGTAETLGSVFETRVSTDACRYSGSCPERGPAPEESCAH